MYKNLALIQRYNCNVVNFTDFAAHRGQRMSCCIK